MDIILFLHIKVFFPLFYAALHNYNKLKQYLDKNKNNYLSKQTFTSYIKAIIIKIKNMKTIKTEEEFIEVMESLPTDLMRERYLKENKTTVIEMIIVTCAMLYNNWYVISLQANFIDQDYLPLITQFNYINNQQCRMLKPHPCEKLIKN